MRINELVARAYDNAVRKGWWDKQRDFGEDIALIHSEVSEALEDFRNGHRIDEVWYEEKSAFGMTLTRLEMVEDTWKPCGIPSELADICIRIFDVSGKNDWGPRLEARVWASNNWQDQRGSFAVELTSIHHDLSQAWVYYNKKNEHYVIMHLAYALYSVMQMSLKYNIDLEQAITEKMAYNATRPHRHGGKVL